MKFIYINNDIIESYRKIDNRVMQNKGGSRPYIALLFLKTDNITWAIPLTSPKKDIGKNKAKVVFELKKQNEELGILLVNNMIPVTEKMYEYIDLNKIDPNYKWLLIKQLTNIKENTNLIVDKISFVFNALKTENRYAKYCCDYVALSERCIEIDNIISQQQNKQSNTLKMQQKNVIEP